jgi:hypothetical protein
MLSGHPETVAERGTLAMIFTVRLSTMVTRPHFFPWSVKHYPGSGLGFPLKDRLYEG